MAFPESIAFPPALIWGFALSLALKEPIQSDTTIIAALGGEANIYCNFSLSMDVLQVTWQKRNGTSFQNMATYSPIYGQRLIEPFQKKVRFTIAAPNTSAITLQNLTLEDDSYYRCIFNVFRHGSFSKEICLNIQSTQKNTVIITSILAAVFLLLVLIYSVMRLYSRRNKQKTHSGAPRTPAKETSLQQDLCERASLSLHTPKDQHITYQNEGELCHGIPLTGDSSHELLHHSSNLTSRSSAKTVAM
ncbi:nectin-1-like [Cinclus cinclus]|uniref:nectin-1-like n=1 Tax=Cinclus cinclus TaxID=127875 RepID=UPI002E146B40